MAEKSKPETEKYEFQAEVRQLLDILTHSLYTHRDVFIRELISNAADALDKVRFQSIKGEEIADPDLDYTIEITPDDKKNSLTITDTGIGMTKKELVDNIGTIARSGTAEFVKQLAAEKSGDLSQIGRFGIGFYSVFMAANRVEITTRSAEPDQPAYRWISDGEGSFEIRELKKKVARGTSIKVMLRKDAEEFAQKFRLQGIIEKYSNFVPFPIMLEKEQINVISAIWREPKSSIKKEQYQEFYKFIAHQEEEALTWMHLSADVPISFNTLLFVPRTNMEHLGFGRDEDGINLFVRRVLIDAHANEILPPYLRFVRGVLESDDLPLNISRETLQENPHLIKIKNTVVNKFLGHLADMAEKEPELYAKIWNAHGRILKEGYNDFGHKDKIAELFRFNSSKSETADELVSLKTYAGRMHEKQDAIYYISGPDRTTLKNNPTTEIFRAKGIEVLYCYDPIDEFALPGLLEYNNKKILSADQADLKKVAEISAGPDTDEAKDGADDKELDNLARRIKDILGDKVEDVRLSERLVDSPAVLVGTAPGVSSQMEKIMQMVNPEAKASKKIMEINKRHPLIRKMRQIYQSDVRDPVLTAMVNSLYTSVLVLDGSFDDPHTMANSIQDLLVKTGELYGGDKSEEKEGEGE